MCDLKIQASTENGDSALHLATRRRDIDMVRILVDYGANVDMQNGEGQTALHICAAEGDESLLKYFYGVRASASITDNQDRTPMHVILTNHVVYCLNFYSKQCLNFLLISIISASGLSNLPT